MTPIFRWDGQYWGFITQGRLFNAAGECKGWIECDGSVWGDDGRYVGELHDGNYILRHSLKAGPVPRVSHVRAVPRVSPVPSATRIGRVPKGGYHDPLEEMH